MSDRGPEEDEMTPEARIRAAEKAAELRRAMEREEQVAKAKPGAVLVLIDGTVSMLVKRGREAPPLT